MTASTTWRHERVIAHIILPVATEVAAAIQAQAEERERLLECKREGARDRLANKEAYCNPHKKLRIERSRRRAWIDGWALADDAIRYIHPATYQHELRDLLGDELDALMAEREAKESGLQCLMATE